MKQLRNKCIAIAVLAGLLMLGVSMIDGLVAERQYLQQQVQDDIARSSSEQQHIIGPIIVAKFKREPVEQVFINSEKSRSISQTQQYYYKVLLPQRYELASTLDTEYRQLGIYKALLYHSKNNITTNFQLPDSWLKEPTAQLTELAMVVAISDVRGIKNGLAITLNKQSFELQPGTGLGPLGSGVHIPLDPAWLEAQHNVDVKLSLNLLGMEDLRISPVGQESSIGIVANWPHPSFMGNFLPDKHTISDQGFSANWQTSFFSTNMPELLRDCFTQEKCGALNEATLGVSLVDPVNQYLKTDRAIKYAELFIALTLLAFMMFEIFKNLSIHPVQYALVGVAMAVFYLLLLSLSEHIDFNLAYLIASVCCAGVIGIYIAGVVGQIKHGVIFSSGILMLYLILFGLLAAEDFALLMGAIFVFLLLAVVMVTTRKIDWYKIGADK